MKNNMKKKVKNKEKSFLKRRNKVNSLASN